jgi:hypothetical protein
MDERRRTADELRALARELVTADAQDAAFAPIADALGPLREQLAGHPRLRWEVDGLHTSDHAAERAGREPLYDRDPLIGRCNPVAPPARRVPGGDLATWEVTLGDLYEGHPGFAHGGWVAAILDHVLGVVACSSGVAAMTGTLTTRYRRPTPLHTRLVCAGEVTRVEGRKVFCRASLEAEGALVAEAEGVYLRVDPDRY